MARTSTTSGKDSDEPLPQGQGRQALSQERVDALLRRFNAQVNVLRRTNDLPPHRLDFAADRHQPFSASRLRSNLQRCFVSLRRLKEPLAAVNRLRTWQDPTRTSGACIAYFAAWISPIGAFQFTVLVLIGLVLFPAFRSAVFPPPASLATDSAVSLGLDLTDGEGVDDDELIALDFTDGMSELAKLNGSSTSLSDVADEDLVKDDQADNDRLSDSLTDDELAANIDASSSNPAVSMSAPPVNSSPSSSPPVPFKILPKRKRTPKEIRVRRIARLERFGLPIQRISGEISDFIERIFNAVDPPHPFSETDSRICIARHLAIIPLLGILLSPRAIMSLMSFLVGVLFFGSPLAGVLAEILDEHVPTWRERVRNRKKLLDPAPTDLQVTIRLLREAEAAGFPLHPPPLLPRRSASTKPVEANGTTKDQTVLGGSVVENSPLPTTTSLRSRFGFHNNSSKSSLVEDPSELLTVPSNERRTFTRGWEKVSKKAADRVRSATMRLDLPDRIKHKVGVFEHDDSSKSSFLALRNGVPGHLVLSSPARNLSKKRAAAWTLTFQRLASISATTTAPSSSSSTSSSVAPLDSSSIFSSFSSTPPTTTSSSTLTGRSTALLSNISIDLSTVTGLEKITTNVAWRSKIALDLFVGSSTSGKGDRGGVKITWLEKCGTATGSARQHKHARHGVVVGGGEELLEERSEIFVGVKRRNELFNRLASVVDAKFVSM